MGPTKHVEITTSSLIYDYSEQGNRMNTIEAVARVLKIEGVEWISCYPSNILIEAVAKEGIRPVMFRHERGAIMAADGYSRTSDRQRFGVVITQAQAGAELSLIHI